MQDITEQQDVAREISEAISGPFGDTFDEVEIFWFFLSFSIFIVVIYFFDTRFKILLGTCVLHSKLFPALQKCI